MKLGLNPKDTSGIENRGFERIRTKKMERSSEQQGSKIIKNSGIELSDEDREMDRMSDRLLCPGMRPLSKRDLSQSRFDEINNPQPPAIIYAIDEHNIEKIWLVAQRMLYGSDQDTR